MKQQERLLAEQRGRLLAELARTDSRVFFGVPEAAILLDCDERTLRKACATGQVPATRLGVTWRVPVTWLRQQVGAAGMVA